MSKGDSKAPPVSGPEAGRQLAESALHVQAAAEETQAEIDGLTKLVVALAKHATALGRRVDAHADADLEADKLVLLREEISALDAAANKTIARLHFAERLQQRLAKVQTNLQTVSDWFTSRSARGAVSAKYKPASVDRDADSKVIQLSTRDSRTLH